MWILYALGSGITCGTGNFFLGLKLSHAGLFGPGIAGPLGCILLLLYRGKTFISSYLRTGNFVDYKNSNWFSPRPPHYFTYSHLIPLAGNFMPHLISLIFIAESLKYAGLAGIN